MQYVSGFWSQEWTILMNKKFVSAEYKTKVNVTIEVY